MKLFDRKRNRCHLLHELGADLIGNRAATRTGHKHAGVMAIDADFSLHAPQEFQAFLWLLGLMALIVAPQHLVGSRIRNHRFHRGGTHVETHEKLRLMIVRFQTFLRRSLRGRTDVLWSLMFVLMTFVLHFVIVHSILSNPLLTPDY